MSAEDEINGSLVAALAAEDSVDIIETFKHLTAGADQGSEC